MKPYTVANLADINEINDGRTPYRPVRHYLGIMAFGVNAWGPRQLGEQLINEHDETGSNPQEELYVVTAGRARFEIGEESLEAPVGSLVFVRPGVRRSAIAAEDGTTLLAIGAGVGQAYRPWGLEPWAALQALFQSGEYAAVADRAADVLASDPPYPLLYYNFACAASLADRPEEALALLRRAIDLDGALREMASNDADLNSLLGDSRFEELLAGP